jgi:hypothetical protein
MAWGLLVCIGWFQLPTKETGRESEWELCARGEQCPACPPPDWPEASTKEQAPGRWCHSP